MVTRPRLYRKGERTRVIDDETLEGWPPETVFMTCTARGALWHVPDRRMISTIVMPKRTLCGAIPYLGAECRSDWLGLDSALVCLTCRAIARD